MCTIRRAKLCVLALSFVVALTLYFNSQSTPVAFAFAEGPPAGNTGAPGESTCVTCHNSFPLNSGPGQVTIQGPSSYVPGQSYQITVRAVTSDNSRRRWGFQLTALVSDLTKAGTLQAGANEQTLSGLVGGASRQYIEHTQQGTFAGQTGGANWTFTWVAPSSDVGTVTLYAACNMANNDGTPQGDQIYTTKISLGTAPPGPPAISAVSLSGKNLIITGTNFDSGAFVFVNDSKIKKTLHSTDSPATQLTAKKAAKQLVSGQTVSVQVKNGDGDVSNMVEFTKP